MAMYLQTSLRPAQEARAAFFLISLGVDTKFNGLLPQSRRNHHALIKTGQRSQVVDIFNLLWCELRFLHGAAGCRHRDIPYGLRTFVDPHADQLTISPDDVRFA